MIAHPLLSFSQRDNSLAFLAAGQRNQTTAIGVLSHTIHVLCRGWHSSHIPSCLSFSSHIFHYQCCRAACTASLTDLKSHLFILIRRVMFDTYPKRKNLKRPRRWKISSKLMSILTVSLYFSWEAENLRTLGKIQTSWNVCLSSVCIFFIRFMYRSAVSTQLRDMSWHLVLYPPTTVFLHGCPFRLFLTQ